MSAGERIGVAVVSATPATSEVIAPRSKAKGGTTTQSSDTTPDTQPSILNGDGAGKSASGSGSPTYRPLVKQSGGSKERWQKPKTLRSFTGQVNAVLTAVMNGEIREEDFEQARLYASLARVVVQAMTTEVQRARFLKTAPDLTFEDDD